ncbi:hypothetical protein BU26DRAFT_513418 [Trematosphaeria pertusa]|uniref:Uncharacterized protein n=1 Tax=Trematosphaeria pertusa TaxID=390896 RepID=A0A6A6J2P5_9PLEO|nr:uncharacterized protein BU26DRAFT_513418 [Trematosphaeria pertusa]KAF2256617.1 hypothetical protein BU26DRAFT_513418 [Trematosphaeria pertusa]
MGLPVWRAPSPEPPSALKADPTAPARSPIRRRSLARARPARSPTSPRLHDYNDVHISLSRFGSADSATRLSSSRPRPPPPPVPETHNYSRQGSSRYTPGLAAEEDSATRSYFRLSTDAPRGLSFEDRRPLPALTPNFAPAAASRSARRDSAHGVRERSVRRSRSPFSRLTAHDFPHLRSGRGSDYFQGRELVRSRGPIEPTDDGEDDSSDNNAVGFPPLRRMGRRTIADGPLPSSSLRESWSPATTLDGLGDRARSVSPVDDHWETMLSSVAPDPLAPTAESSFTSAAASASFSNSHPSSRAGSSNSNSVSSSRTHLTVPSRRNSPGNDLFLRACDTSEDSASDTEEEDMDIRPDSSLLRRSTVGGASSYEPPLRNPLRYSRGVRERSRESSAYVRSFYGEVAPRDLQPQPERRISDQLDGPVEERNAADEDMPLDQELRDARALLERLSRRDDISDEFWASVGLRRPLADRVERIQQRERL